MAEEREQFRSIYGDVESEFEMEDVSDETLSISKEEIEAAIAEDVQEEKADEQPVETSAGESAGEERPAEEPASTAASADTEDAASAGEVPTDDPSSDEPADQETSEITVEEHPREHHTRHNDDATDGVYEDEDREDEETEDEPVGIVSYILHAILFTIPVIGTIVMLVYIISNRKNSHLRHFAQIWLVTLLLIAIGIYAAITILGIA